ncbi:MAG TPA: 4Fe-4S dicluster domain-containing protein [candidate division WOR-3 bacterium]|uniref:4Fe-4S dicluster domain-containing protein n=1 Tax=candidate division WOR-3 bacterium TaxID=2052148 RepID=A0A9C9EPA9_UNCW3|nr:4Fe-4S dicluster domain-containing protein [candidate division WOR-3 bacterium]
MNSIPSEERRKKRPYVVIECPEKIPCDPCVGACPQKAISMPGSMIELPQVDYDKCTGCLLCIPKCPGLAIFVIDETPEDHSVVFIPYEFLPRPQKGEIAIGVDREGKERCDVEIIKVLDSPKFDHCAIIGFSVPKDLAGEIRALRLKR